MAIQDSSPHPDDRQLGRFASNEVGTQRKKVLARHLESCEECRSKVSRFRAVARRFRDIEHQAISHHAAQAKAEMDLARSAPETVLF